MSFYSSIYGLRIAINERIPGIVASESTTGVIDLKITLGSPPGWFPRSVTAEKVWYISPSEREDSEPRLIIRKPPDDRYYHFRYSDGTEFLVESHGAEVWGAWPSETLTLEDTATYLLGPIMGFVLLLRGSTCLHASAIAIREKAIALVGPAGAGKSTTAAAFADRGYRILAEDVVTLNDRKTDFWVPPGYPSIRLWPTSVEALYGGPHELPKLTPTWDKRYLDLTRGKYAFQRDSLPLGAIYLLGPRSDDPAAPFVQELSRGQALMSLIANTYATNLMNREMRAREFELLGRVVSQVPVRHVIPHADPRQIGCLCDCIISDFETIRASTQVSSDQELAVHV